MSGACVYLFDYLNMKDTPTRGRYIRYYSLYYMENIVLISLWYSYTDKAFWFRIPMLVVVLVSFPLGVFFMLIYYKLLHPDAGVWLQRHRKTYKLDNQQKPESRCSG